MCILKITKGYNSLKGIGGVMIFVLCTMSGNAIYLYQVLPKHLKGFQSYRSQR